MSQQKQRGYAVYALLDPRDRSIRYIGISNNVARRLAQHIREARSSSPKDQWLQELHSLGMAPAITILQEIDTLSHAREREKYWIGNAAQTCPLLNWNLNTANLDCGTRIDEPEFEAHVYEELMRDFRYE